MAKLERTSKFFIDGKQYEVEAVLKNLIILPAPYITENFSSWGLQIPRSDRMNAMRAALRESVAKVIAKNDPKDQEFIQKLRKFDDLSETQLENVFKQLNRKPLRENFLKEIWLVFIEYLLFRDIFANELGELIKQAEKEALVEGDKIVRNVSSFLKDTEEIFFDEVDNVDGLPQADFEKVVLAVSDEEEMRQIASKHNVRLQEQWKKREYANLIVDEVKKKKLYKKEEESDKIKDIRALTVDELLIFAKDNKLQASINLTKQEQVKMLAADIIEERGKEPLNSKQTAQIKKLNADKKKLNEELRELKATSKQQLKERDEQLKAQDKSIKALEKELEALKKQLEGKKGSAEEQAKLKAQIKNLENELELEKAKKAKVVVEEKVVDNTELIAELNGKIEAQNQLIEKLRANQGDTVDAKRLQDLVARVSEMRAHVLALTDERNVFLSELDEHKQYIEDLEAENERLKAARAELEKAQCELQAQRAVLEEKVRLAAEHDQEPAEEEEYYDDDDDFDEEYYEELLDRIYDLEDENEELREELEQERNRVQQPPLNAPINIYFNGVAMPAQQAAPAPVAEAPVAAQPVQEVAPVEEAPAPAKKKSVAGKVILMVLFWLIFVYVFFFVVMGIITLVVQESPQLTQIVDFIDQYVYPFGIFKAIWGLQ